MDNRIHDATIPLIQRHRQESIAYIHRPLAILNGHQGEITAEQFLSHVKQLAKTLPEHKYAINLCSNRYLFMVSLCAAIVRKQTNLLPPNKNTITQKALYKRYSNSYVIHDGGLSESGPQSEKELSQLDLSTLSLRDGDDFEVPVIAADHIAVISFTSGSTGNSQPIEKTWGTLTASTEINRQYMVPNKVDTFYQLATVPGQHMWGLETSILLALMANVCVVDNKPFFPEDIKVILATLPNPKILVSTPVHLRALVASPMGLLSVDRVLCATAPLSQSLAQQTEKYFSAQLREIYGCSEIGSMAFRDTAHNEVWSCFDGIEFTIKSDKKVMVGTAHVLHAIELQDTIVMTGEKQFRLEGRATDMINIAGKRGSLYEINQVLQAFPGLIDGTVFFPPQDRTVPRLVALVVLKAGISKQDLSDYFWSRLDSAFVPRPILLVPSLLREENGKLPRQRLIDLYHDLICKETE
ncbi:acyl-CoA synthetase [Gammaproteobacteria bacterium AH-315-M22]|nr:acyl-CoA synthetase [Gammaproteobacteria bacterium AH-315-M22]